MKMRTLGKDGPQIHPIGYGAMSFSDFYGPTNEAESHAILDMCRAEGVNHIDSANVYGMGKSESAIGSYLAAHPGARDDFVIATKVGIARDADGNRYYDNTLPYMEAQLDQSLARMGIEAVDLYYIHRRNAEMPIEEATGNLARLVEAGKVKAIGFSEIAPSSLRRAQAEHPIGAVQSEYSLQTRSPELGLVQTCKELGVALVAFSPVGRGFLTDTPPDAEKASGLGFLKSNPRFVEPNLSANLAYVARFQALAAEFGVPAAGLANAWLLAQGEHVIPIPGTRSTAHFAQILAGASLELSAADLVRIEEVLPVGWCHGDRYNAGQWVGPERYC